MLYFVRSSCYNSMHQLLQVYSFSIWLSCDREGFLLLFFTLHVKEWIAITDILIGFHFILLSLLARLIFLYSLNLLSGGNNFIIVDFNI